MDVISLNSVCKSFQNHSVLNGITLSINEGEIFGLLGPSGAGKTTLIKLLLGLYAASAGTINVLGQNPLHYTDNVRNSFGMVLDSDGLYERLSCFNNLYIYSVIYRISDKKRNIETLLEKVGLFEARNTKVESLSKGMRQRLVFARSILHNPKIIFLDEPTSGLDPATAQLIHKIMISLRDEGTTIFLTTHNMMEAQQMCDSIALLDEGKIIEFGTPEEICFRNCSARNATVELAGGQQIKIDLSEVEKRLKDIYSSKDKIISIHSDEPNLEDVFIKLTGRGLR